MNIEKELRVRLLLEYMRSENETASRETQHGDGWKTDHSMAIWHYGAEIEAILAEAALGKGEENG
jgi:hypothetical protein